MNQPEIQRTHHSILSRIFASRLLSCWLLLAALAPGELLAGESRLSVMEVPASGDRGAQVVVHWNGPLPVRLEAGVEHEDRGFIPTNPAIELTESMTLLPRPTGHRDGLPAWRVVDSQSRVLARTRGSSLVSGWHPEFFGPGLDAGVEVATIFRGDLVIAGEFHTAGNQEVNGFARWDGSQWSALDDSGSSATEIDGTVYALTEFDGDLIVGGRFTTAGGVTVNNIARWDGSEWAALDGPAGIGVVDDSVTQTIVYTLTVLDDDLIAGGRFTTAGGVTVNNIARWDGSQWSALDGPSPTGTDHIVSVVLEFDGDLIAGGHFTSAGGVTVNNIARWDGSQWSALDGPAGTGMDDGIVDLTSVQTLTRFDGDLIAGGRFTTAGGVTVNRIARWDGSQWSALDGPAGTGTDFTVRALTTFAGDLIAGGQFATAGGVTVNRIARWDGSQWSVLDGPAGTGINDVPGGAIAWILIEFNGDLIAGGEFATAGGVTAHNIARWDGSQWSALDGSSATGTDTLVAAVTKFDGDLIAGGEFDFAGGEQVNHIARWDGSQWSALDGPTGTGIDVGFRVSVLTVYDGDLIAGGYFTSAGGVTVNNIARWDGSQWSALDEGVDFLVYGLTVYDGDLIAGGQWGNIARWDGSQWSTLDGSSGAATNGWVRVLTVYGDDLIAGGDFTTAGGVTVNHIARWDGNQWSALDGPAGTGMDDDVEALTEFDGDLIAGGQFTTAGGVTVNRVARWNGSEWSALDGPSGTGTDDDVSAVTEFNGDLIVGGRFITAGGVTVNRIARWDGSEWSALDRPSGTGMNGSVSALDVFESDLIAGGGFTVAGGVSSWRMGRYGVLPFTIGGTVSGLEGSGLVLQNNGGDDLAIATDGAFTFATALDDGSSFEVTVLTQPSDPDQICNPINGSGTLAGTDIDDVRVECRGDLMFSDRFAVE